MNNLFTDIEVIDRYLKGASKEKEVHEVRERLANDAKFRQLFDEMELMIEGIKTTAIRTSKEEKLEHLRNFFNEAYEPSDDQPHREESEYVIPDTEKLSVEEPIPGSGLGKGKVIIFPAADLLGRYKVAIAAAVTLLIAAWFVVFQMNPVTNQQLFAEHFEKFPNLSSPLRSADPEYNEIQRAYAAYDNDDFQQAVMLFEEAITSEDQLLDKFYLGNAYLALGNAEKAIENLQVLENAGTGLGDAAKWYLGLSYLVLDDVEMAISKFDEVKAAGGEHAREAEKILNKLQ